MRKEYDFWVAPGGGAEGTEDLLATAKREVFEESGLHVEPLQLEYHCSEQNGQAGVGSREGQTKGN